MIATIRRTLSGTAAAVAFAASFAAQAAYYSSTWDPPALVVNAVFEIENCSGGGGGRVPANNSSTTCTASLYSLVATLNEIKDESTNQVLRPGPAYIDFITPAGFRGSSDPGVSDPNESTLIEGLYFSSSGDLLGVDWQFWNLGCVTCPLIGLPSEEENSAYVVLPNDGPWLLAIANSDIGDPMLSTAYLIDLHQYRICGWGHCLWIPGIEHTAEVEIAANFGGTSGYLRYEGETAPRLDVAGRVVPEPGSLVLLAGAVCAVWITRRRRPIG